MYNTSYFFFVAVTATFIIYTLSLHDALPICKRQYTPEDFTHLSLNCSVVARAAWYGPTRPHGRNREETSQREELQHENVQVRRIARDDCSDLDESGVCGSCGRSSERKVPQWWQRFTSPARRH